MNKQNEGAQNIVRRIELDTIKKMFDPVPVMKYIIMIVISWMGYSTILDMEIPAEYPLGAEVYLWLTIMVSLLSYLLASAHNVLAPTLAFVTSIVLLASGMSFAAAIVNLLTYIGLIIHWVRNAFVSDKNPNRNNIE